MGKDVIPQCDSEETAACRKLALRGYASAKISPDTFKVMNGLDTPMMLHRHSGVFTRAELLKFAADLDPAR